jgi:hypothetical protein
LRACTSWRVADDASSPLEHTFTLGREPLEPGTAVDQQDAERFFELFYTGRQGRLRYAAYFSGAAKMPLPGQRQ